MGAMEGPGLACLLGGVEAFGLLSAWLARLSEGSPSQSWCQTLFLACLGLVGSVTIATLGLSPGYWLSAGATLSVMVLAVICDFQKTGRAAVW